MSTTAPPRFAYQPALDGVRALAVVAVLAFHGGVAALPGGFLGVDAFFVLSGFLITSLLLAEQRDTGRIDLVAFWGRRFRRLLPALLLVLAVVLLVSRWLLPDTELTALRWDALAALGYLANWRMANRDGDYFAATGSPSPLQHTWSLGIEEQFYLLWPLLLGLLLALTARRAGGAPSGGRRLGAVLALTLGGALASATAAALLFAPDAVDRVYYGTDTRAVALLVGAALAVALARRAPSPPAASDPPAAEAAPAAGAAPSPRVRRVLGALALAGAVGTGWLWATANGGDRWLYRGGLTLAALAVAAVIAHAAVSPAGPTARLLALPPLVWTGRISYGLYLWHWPLFQWCDAERTGLTGPALLAARCALTLAVAVASYLLVERPIRRARRLPRVTPALAGAAVAAVATLAVFGTVTPPVAPTPATAIAWDTTPTPSATTSPVAGSPAPTPPVRRPGREPGRLPRVTFLGDSVSWSLGSYLPEQDRLAVSVRAVQGCGIARLPELRYVGGDHTNYPGCETWDNRWWRSVDADDPDVAVILLDRWELVDRRLDGRWQHVGDPAYDAYLAGELDRAIDIAGGRGAHVVLLTAPYTRRAERPDGGLWPEDDAQRVDAWNRLLADAAERKKASLLDLNRRVCPDGEFSWEAGGIRVRSDGLHFTPRGVREWIAPWLLPELHRLAVQGVTPGSGPSPTAGTEPTPDPSATSTAPATTAPATTAPATTAPATTVPEDTVPDETVPGGEPTGG
ncbi:acyltransferase family protein [Micromonospora mirobrigensis]|uniref:Peptidoglycan/LPS O-acetylase OafA/YrhL, contains acyltransferase and SGNH-hydrolase domains n=1 Tax=Micromonospora mirobrigensis TaxID=262898 RepID=A0A1C5AJH8_9ACTN|nr:acyltransferase family protein [Micromonospora mirobrigensis]SCF45388.1 Peptidoglycan/LPS O-acetylase OafA/YrhL, contains acyltransferase and SGNH-hydrolase domains [Micromonospora mirobrigensis]